jgi:hypothetical protein
MPPRHQHLSVTYISVKERERVCVCVCVSHESMQDFHGRYQCLCVTYISDRERERERERVCVCKRLVVCECHVSMLKLHGCYLAICVTGDIHKWRIHESKPCVYIHTYIQTYTDTCVCCKCGNIGRTNVTVPVCMHVCMHVCMYVCMYVLAQDDKHRTDERSRTCMYAVCMHVCMHVCTHVCMYVCIHIYGQMGYKRIKAGQTAGAALGGQMWRLNDRVCVYVSFGKR